MKKNVGILTALLRLDGKQFGQALKQQKGRVAAFARFVKTTVAPLAAIAGGVFTARAVGQTLSHVDAQAKLAKSLNTTYSSMQTLERAGELTGVSMSSVEQGAKDLFRRLSQAAAEGGPAADALKRLNLRAEDLLKMPLDQRIGTINKALIDFVPQAERAAVAGKLFGEEGAIAITRLDPGAIAQAADEIRKFGREVSDVEAAKIEAANDALTRVRLAARGIGTDITIAIAPALERGADMITRWAGGFRVFLGILKDVFFLVGNTVATLFEGSTAANALTQSFFGGVRAVWAMFERVRALLAGLRAVVESGGGMGELWNHIRAIAVEALSRIILMLRALGDRSRAAFAAFAAAAVERFGEILGRGREWAEGLADTAIGAKDAMIAAFKALPAAMGDLMIQGANSVVSAVEKMLNAVVSRMNGFIQTINSAIMKLPEWARGDFAGIGQLNDVSLGSISNPFAGAPGVGSSASDAFAAAQGSSNFGSSANPLAGKAAALLNQSNNFLSRALDSLTSARKPMETVKGLSDAMDRARTAADEADAAMDGLSDGLTDVEETAGGAADALSKGGGSSGGGKSLADAAEEASQEAKQLETNIQTTADALAGVAVGAQKWSQVAVNAIQKVARAWISSGIEKALGVISSGSGGGKTSIFGSILGAILPRRHGGGVRAGQIYQVNEDTPRSEWMFSSNSGGILNHAQMRDAVGSAIGGSSGGDTLNINANVDPAVIMEISRGEANHLIGENNRAVDAGLNNRIRNATSDPWKR